MHETTPSTGPASLGGGGEGLNLPNCGFYSSLPNDGKASTNNDDSIASQVSFRSHIFG
jgi:hypothetical protein